MERERFPLDLDLRKLQGNEWELISPFRYWCERLGAWIEVPRGFRTDLASVPWFGRWFVSVDGDHTKAAIVHDWLYVSGSAVDLPQVTRRDADQIFLEALTVRGVPAYKRNAMYAAVRIGGGRMFRDD